MNTHTAAGRTPALPTHTHQAAPLPRHTHRRADAARALLLALGVLAVCPGCALTNESPAARRADTYDVATSLKLNPRTGELEYVSTGDDAAQISGLKIGDNSVQEIRISQLRSPVVLAQGQRAKDMTELMGQQIALNAEWRMALTETLTQVRGIAADLAPLALAAQQQRAAARPAETAANTAAFEARIAALETLLRALQSGASGAVQSGALQSPEEQGGALQSPAKTGGTP